jgi:hypothetical protein
LHKLRFEDTPKRGKGKMPGHLRAIGDHKKKEEKN